MNMYHKIGILLEIIQIQEETAKRLALGSYFLSSNMCK